ncbi:Hypothetical predicted protein [Cloeon dipterum]|uniref:Uncharacterized protein n=1 Tax=Cloeon dipterum TaxID=197152 RepID=A0A8S1CQE2_9INSE|nr:Hypothetical predicted protein [Cloeon dipterum]
MCDNLQRPVSDDMKTLVTLLLLVAVCLANEEQASRTKRGFPIPNAFVQQALPYQTFAPFAYSTHPYQFTPNLAAHPFAYIPAPAPQPALYSSPGYEGITKAYF